MSQDKKLIDLMAAIDVAHYELFDAFKKNDIDEIFKIADDMLYYVNRLKQYAERKIEGIE